MSATSRNDIMQGLVNLLSGIHQFKTVSRKFKLWTEMTSEEKPALFVLDHEEDYARPYKRGIPPTVTIDCVVIVYFDTRDPNKIPAVQLDYFLDAIDSALSMPPGENAQTLGGLVSHCWIEGRVTKVPGDVDKDGTGLLLVPVKILIPARRS